MAYLPVVGHGNVSVEKLLSALKSQIHNVPHFLCNTISTTSVNVVVTRAPNVGVSPVWHINLVRLSATLAGKCLYQNSHDIKSAESPCHTQFPF